MDILRKNKKLLSVLSFGIFTLSALVACSTPTNQGTIDLKAFAVTELSGGKSDVSIMLKWNNILGAKYFSIEKAQDGGSPASIGISKIEGTSYEDKNLSEKSAYLYYIDALDSNNKIVASTKTSDVKPISSDELVAPVIEKLKADNTLNTISRRETISWSTTKDADLYYVTIINDNSNKRIFGSFTQDKTISLDVTTSPVNAPEILQSKLPVVMEGLEPAVKHTLLVYSIKFNNPESFEKSTSIGMSPSAPVKVSL